MPRTKTIFAFIICILLPQLFGLFGSLFTFPSIPSWYAGLIKSPLNPPSWVFAPVWTTLFLLMGIAAFLVWRKGWKHKQVKLALAIFVGQLILNTLWSYLFFGMHSPGAAFVGILFLWLAIVATIISFYRVSKPALYLLLPYILWVSFAGVLNYSIWNLNKDLPSNGVVCTLEAKFCPDGSYVGRTGPHCEFAPCPSEANIKSGKNQQHACTLELRMCPDGSGVGRTGPNCEFTPCPDKGPVSDKENIPLPVGYTLESYSVAEVLNQSCTKNEDCKLPMEYAVRSNCPYVAPCLNNKCTVVCPNHKIQN